jgi:adenosylcobinamide-GDP ribazoletransferase
MQGLRNQLHVFLTAVMFYTRLPCPRWVDHSADKLTQATRYFPLVGWIVGLLAAVIYYGAAWILPASLALVLALLSSILLTGAFHEDGLADVCDGFGGGWTPAQILQIMKDSRVGTYGVVGLVGLLAAKFLSLQALPQGWTGIALLTGHALSRFLAATYVIALPYVREDAGSKAKPVAGGQARLNIWLPAALFGLLPLLLLWPAPLYTASLVLVAAVYVYLLGLFRRRLGGYTGDCLGAAQQLLELAWYLGLVMVLHTLTHPPSWPLLLGD